jgi:hypothetical protein
MYGRRQWSQALGVDSCKLGFQYFALYFSDKAINDPNVNTRQKDFYRPIERQSQIRLSIPDNPRRRGMLNTMGLGWEGQPSRVTGDVLSGLIGSLHGRMIEQSDF